ncbi:hypothetical protein K491DRAFT_713118 [Lophiostoma macrostomum CBS 122681]|uniref:Uncharacterized protein n=1 Tax=Lophiostoma macrostomum CBS 122681 TaxID=1314788 RepID=A0A6A6TFX2_9PLEO|nr:hypothetical protein K491DRAFT_713118 [Lophiostoma macrostomum CBS 122681]
MHAQLALLSLPLLAFSVPAPLPFPATGSASANHAMVINSCPYSVYLQSISGGASSVNNATDRSQVLAPGATYTEAMRNPGFGIALKISNGTAATNTVTQLEYALDPSGDVWYDLSFINCIVDGSYDAAKCPGHDYGLKAKAGQGCKDFTCGPNEVCIGQAYWLKENGYQGGAPVSQCAASKGLTFELCYAHSA